MEGVPIVICLTLLQNKPQGEKMHFADYPLNRWIKTVCLFIYFR